MIDSHCHLDFAELRPDLSQHVARARACGVCAFLVPGCFPEQWQQLASLTNEPAFQDGELHLGLGLHPFFTEETASSDDLCAKLAVDCRVQGAVFLGEVGLHANRGASLEIQRGLFEAQLALASELSLPVVIHEVGARDLLFSAIKRVGLPAAGGVVHGFSGDEHYGQALITRGLHLGIGAAITRDAKQRLRCAVARLPLESLLLETDCPDQGVRRALAGGRRPFGVPADLLLVAQELSMLRNQPLSEVQSATECNARRLFSLPKA